MIKLYTWGTPNGNKLSMMLEETGVAYELIPVNLGNGEQRAPEFIAINPNGKIPAIVDTDGPGGRPFILAESGAILIYLAEKTGRLMSNTVRERMATLQWIMFQMSHVGPMIGQLHHFMASAPPGNEYGVERYRKEGDRLMDVLDRRLDNSQHLVDGDYSIADIATWPWVRSWVHTTRQALGARPALIRWYEAIEQRPATVKAIEIYNDLRNNGTK